MGRLPLILTRRTRTKCQRSCASGDPSVHFTTAFLTASLVLMCTIAWTTLLSICIESSVGHRRSAGTIAELASSRGQIATAGHARTLTPSAPRLILARLRHPLPPQPRRLLGGRNHSHGICRRRHRRQRRLESSGAAGMSGQEASHG
jgi:hypothetical protein